MMVALARRVRVLDGEHAPGPRSRVELAHSGVGAVAAAKAVAS
jgi:hypothetical protein